ncbi:MAG: type II toxin-antitoxin system VapC family toxin [Myxococcales bacterium]|nr:type II toxin-antitoxin system VapC family toxin [Myxococcales bacterium]
MKLLIDTHVVLWAAVGDPRLTGPMKARFEDPDNQLVVSVASLWEISIKYSIGKLPLPVVPGDFFAREVATRGYSVLDVGRAHAERVAVLPFPEGGHRDPFDRMLVAQALVQGLPLLSADGWLGRYESYGLVRCS